MPFTNALLQIFCIVLPVVAVGVTVSGCNRLFLKGMGYRLGSKAVFVTSILGTPVHELGHAFACILFGHKITGIKLISFDPADRQLGYVKHSFRPKNLYHRIGNFFIGIAPIFSGCLVLFLGLLLMPGGWSKIGPVVTGAASGVTDLNGILPALGRGIGDFFRLFFSREYLASPWWWCYLFFGCCFALHMDLSTEDIKGGLAGLAALCIAVLAFNLIAGAVSMEFLYLTDRWLAVYTVSMCVFLLLAVLFSLLCVVVGGCAYLIRSALKRGGMTE